MRQLIIFTQRRTTISGNSWSRWRQEHRSLSYSTSYCWTIRVWHLTISRARATSVAISGDLWPSLTLLLSSKYCVKYRKSTGLQRRLRTMRGSVRNEWMRNSLATSANSLKKKKSQRTSQNFNSKASTTTICSRILRSLSYSTTCHAYTNRVTSM